MLGIQRSAKTFLVSSHPWLQKRAAWCTVRKHMFSVVWHPRLNASRWKCMSYRHTWLISRARSGNVGLLTRRIVLFCSLRISWKVGFSRKCLSHQNEALKEVLWHKNKEAGIGFWMLCWGYHLPRCQGPIQWGDFWIRNEHQVSLAWFLGAHLHASLPKMDRLEMEHGNRRKELDTCSPQVMTVLVLSPKEICMVLISTYNFLKDFLLAKDRQFL